MTLFKNMSIIMSSLHTKNSINIKDDLSTVEKTAHQGMTFSSSTSEIQDNSLEADTLDDITLCIHTLLRIEKMTNERLDTVEKQLRHIKKHIARFVALLFSSNI